MSAECDIRSLFRYQDQLILREGLLIAYFLARLVVLGRQQPSWPQPPLMSMSNDAAFLGAAVLTVFTGNAAVTYLAHWLKGCPLTSNTFSSPGQSGGAAFAT
jgi:hypothetical protein